MRSGYWLASAVLLLVLIPPAPCPAASAETMYVTEREVFVPVPLVVTASRLQQTPAKAPASVTIIDRAMIEASTAIDIPDLLRLVPGAQVTYANGHIFSVMYHGGETAWSHRMQVLVDGRSVYNPLFSIVFWNHLDIDIEDIERIEVIRGPNAPVYGSNAFRGTINIITKQPFRDSGVTAKALAGSLDTRQGMLRYAGGSDDFEYRVTVGHRSDDGFDNINDRKDLNTISYRGVYDPTTNDSIDLQAGLTDGPVGAWGRNPVTSPDRDIETRSAHAFLRWRHVFSPNNESHLQVYHNYLNWNDLYEAGPVSALFNDRGFPVTVTPEMVPLLLGKPDQSFLISFFHGRGTRSDIEWQQTMFFSERWRMVWGTGFRRDTFESAQVLGHNDRIDDDTLRLFGNLEWSPSSSWGFNAGVMVEENDISGTHLSPRLAGNYTFTPGHTLRAIATRAIRTPSLYEAYEFNMVRFNDGDVFMALYVSDPDLEHETIDSYEIGYRGLFADSRVDLDIKVFQEQLGNLINHARDPTYPDILSEFLIGLGATEGDIGSFILINGGNADVSGAETQLRFRPDPRTILSLQYSYVTIDGEIMDVISGFNEGNITPVRVHRTIEQSTPRHTASALLSRNFSRDWQISVAYFYLSDTDWAGDGQFVRGYNRWDARLGKGFSLWNARGNLSLIVQNLSGREYAEFRRENVFERRAYLQLKLRS